MITRGQITAALAAVAGVSASSTRPSTIAAGQAWPAWASTKWLNMRADGPREVRWFVFLVLTNASLDASVAAGDPKIEEIGQAMADLQLRVELVEPVAIQVAGQSETVPAIRFTLAD